MTTLPTLRDKKRYMAFELASEQSISRSELSAEISNSVCSLFGDAGAALINPGLVAFDGKYGIVRCAKERTTEARAALAGIARVRKGRISILVLGISGTVRGAASLYPHSAPVISEIKTEPFQKM